MKDLTSYITEYVVSGRRNKHIIVATDETIHQIVKDELDRLGHDADLNHIDVSEVTNMKSLFSCHHSDNLGPKYKDLNPDISYWDVSNVENMEFMFFDCENFNQDLSGWDVRKVENHGFMFNRCPIEEEYKPKFK